VLRSSTPDEYERMREQLNPRHRLIFDGMLFTGMRIEEFLEVRGEPAVVPPRNGST